MGRTTMVGVGLLVFVVAAGHSGVGFAADKEKPAKKPKSSAESKVPK